MSDTLSLGDWLRPALPLLLLKFLMDRPSHGYGLVEQLREAGIEARGTTVYPHLNKLQEAGYITSQWQTPEAGPAKKILTVSDAGRSHFRDLGRTWSAARELIDTTLNSMSEQ